ncbi:integral membrane protein S linking to the trans Golgi network-domain-containing protein [Globomyces pollinis-pini]|nr:integral membrane protein S linking to the trans Golgi network-domain-containing protein [Globomyces pollinis-pini]
MKSGFRSNQFDAILISSQIVCLQSLYYGFLGFLTIITELLSAQPITLAHIFDPSFIQLTVFGCSLFIMHILSVTLLAAAMMKLIKRSRLCLDFAITLHLFHLVFIWIYNHSLPSHWFWWFMKLVSLTVLIVLSQKLCLYEELLPIDLIGHRKNDMENSLEMDTFINQ